MAGLSCWSKKMADVKISALPASTTPLAGTEVLPIVQSSTTKQVSVANLTAGRDVSALSYTASGNLTFTGTGNRITGDFSNATNSSRVAFQTSTVNGNTIFGIIPNGTGTGTGFTASNNSDINNASLLSLNSLSADARILATLSGTGTYLPLTLWTGGSERLRIDTSGNLLQNISTYPFGGSNRFVSKSATTTTQQIYAMCSANDSSTYLGHNGTVGVLGTTYGSTGSYLPLAFYTSDAERMRIDSSGNVGVGTTSTTGKLNVAGNVAIANGGWFGFGDVDERIVGDNSGFMQFFTAGSERMRINSTGNVLINRTTVAGAGNVGLIISGDTDTTGTNYTFYTVYNNGAQVFGLKNDGYVRADGVYNKTSATSANVNVDSGGSLTRSTSALKYKTDIRDLESIDINQFRPVRYKSKCEIDDPTLDHFGIIADEVHDAGITELVTYGADGEVAGFQYERLTVVLLKAIQELKAEFDAYKATHP
jgi:hypothetical protein